MITDTSNEIIQSSHPVRPFRSLRVEKMIAAMTETSATARWLHKLDSKPRRPNPIFPSAASRCGLPSHFIGACDKN